MSVRAPAGDRPAFRPHPLLAGFHRMTVACAWPRRGPAAVERRLFATGEGTSVLGLCSWQPGARAPTLLICHGLTGHADRPYVRGLAAAAHAAGYAVVRLNTRNCGGTESLTPTLYHAGLVEDLAAVVDELVAEGRGPLVLAGFSLGGNVVLRLAALWGTGGPSEVLGVAAVSPSVDLAACQQRIDGDPALRFYRAYFLRGLREMVRRKAALNPGRWDTSGLDEVDTLWEYDERWTAPSFGFAGAADYYRRASALAVLADLARPALLIHSRDDRIVPREGAERAAGACPSVRLEMSERGGHCGFVSRHEPANGHGGRWWADGRLLAFFDGLLGDRATACPE